MLKKLLQSIIKGAVRIGERKLENIKNALLSRLALLFIGAGEEIALALLDDDKNNEAQLAAIIRRNTAVAIQKGSEIGREKLLALKDVQLATAIVAYLNGAEEMLTALVDENPDNEAQIKDIWQRRRRELLGETLDIATDKLAELVKAKIKDPILAGIVIEILQSLDELVKSGDQG